jgi:hypothetical protein
MRLALALLAGALLSPALAAAEGVERNFAGSAQLDYLLVPTSPRARAHSLDGFTTELAVKLAVDFSERVSASVKICYGCHGFETHMAFVDMRVVDQFNVRLGRMNPSFGDFPLRNDPANHRASSKPLPYDMGRMLRGVEWNLGVLPSPYVDNGAEVYGTQWFGDDVQLDYAAHVMSGLKGSASAGDLNFVESRSGSLYYVDNNSRPSFGGRLALTANLSEAVSATLGASALRGQYDPEATLDYVIAGADLFLRLDALVLRGEYLLRRTDTAPGSADAFRYRQTPGKDFFVKDGFYVEAEYPFTAWLEGFARFDGLRRKGNVALRSPLRSESAVLRQTVGVNVLIERSLRLKLSAEHWDFSDFDDELAAHVGITANF